MREKKSHNIFFGAIITVAVLVIVIGAMAIIQVTPLSVYRDPQYHFSLKYPSYWTVVERPQNGAALVQFMLPPSSALDSFIENVSITTVDLSRNPEMTDLKRFTRSTTGQMTGVFGEYLNILETRDIRMGGQPAFRFVYVTHADTAATKGKMKYLHVWTLRGTQALIITYMGNQDDFDTNLPHVNRIIRTFTFSKS